MHCALWTSSKVLSPLLNPIRPMIIYVWFAEPHINLPAPPILYCVYVRLSLRCWTKFIAYTSSVRRHLDVHHYDIHIGVLLLHRISYNCCYR
jgi:hypothetical protein